MFQRCMELCSALLTCVGSISLITRLAVFFEFSPILFGTSELCSERGYSNYVRQVDW